MKRTKLFLTALLFSFTVSSLNALSLVDYDLAISNIFGGLVNDNEGLTSYRSLLIPEGGRAESLGDAFTGLADDVSYFNYNPAASCILNQTEINCTHNQWIADSTVETVSATTRFDNLGFGAYLKLFTVPFTEYDIFGEKKSSGNYFESIIGANVSYNHNVSYKFKGIAAGANIKAAVRGVPDFGDSLTKEKMNWSGLSQSGIALMADLGVMARFNFAKNYASREPNLRVGASITNLGFGLTGFGTSSFGLDDPLPTKISLGASYKIIKPVTVTLDLCQPVNLADILSSGLLSAGAGVCVQLTDSAALLGGIRLQGANPRFSFGGEFTIEAVQMNLNYTLDLSSSANPVNRFSITAKMQFGDRGRGQKEQEVLSLYQQGLYYYVLCSQERNRTKALGYLNDAQLAWEQVLLMDKTFEPAVKGLDILYLERENLNKVQEAQKLE